MRREAEALAAAGARVDVLCLRAPGERSTEELGGVRYRRLPLRRRRGGAFRYVIDYGAFFVLAFVCSSWLAVRRRYQWFQAHNMPDFLIFCGMIPRLRDAATVLDLHDLSPEVFLAKYDLAERSLPVRALHLVERLSCRWADRVITTSFAFERTLLGRGVPREKLSVVLNSPDPALFPEGEERVDWAGDGELRLVYHGSIVRRSGLDVALQALARLLREAPRARMVVLGDGDASGDCRSAARALGLEHLVEFRGHRPLREIPGHVREAHIGLVPNRKNAFTESNLPTRIFEYLHLGMPVVAARTAGVEELFGPDGLIYFTPEDPEALSLAILRAFRDPAWARETLRKGRAVYQRYHWTQERSKYLELLQAAAGKRGSQPARPMLR